MSIEVAYAGVRDANTGEHLAGVASADLVKAVKAAGTGAVLASCADGQTWQVSEELPPPGTGGFRLVTLESVKDSPTAKEGT